MARGRLRIYFGAAPGVGKAVAMLDEGWRRRRNGADVVVGHVETHGRLPTAERIRDLEVIPLTFRHTARSSDTARLPACTCSISCSR